MFRSYGGRRAAARSCTEPAEECPGRVGRADFVAAYEIDEAVALGALGFVGTQAVEVDDVLARCPVSGAFGPGVEGGGVIAVGLVNGIVLEASVDERGRQVAVQRVLRRFDDGMADPVLLKQGDPSRIDEAWVRRLDHVAHRLAANFTRKRGEEGAERFDVE